MYRFSSLLLLSGFLFFISVIVVTLPVGQPPMVIGQQIQSLAVEQTGAANFVTAVVLGYRGIDTLGELSILFAAAAAGSLVLSARVGGKPRNHETLSKPDKESQQAGFLVTSAADLLMPLLIVVGLYIVIHGHLTPGGGFQGGVILAAAFFLPVLARPSNPLKHNRLVFLEGFAGASFIVIGLIGLFYHNGFLVPMLEKGNVGELFSAGTLPLLYSAVGLKVGVELAGLLSLLNEEDDQ